MAETELEKFDAETKELKHENESKFEGLSNFGLVVFTIAALGVMVISDEDIFKERPLTLRSLKYINIVGLIAFVGAKLAFNTKLIVKLCCGVGLWMHLAFCFTLVLHPKEIEVTATIIVSTGIVILSIIICGIYNDYHELAKRERMRSRIIIDMECGISYLYQQQRELSLELPHST